MGSKGRSSEQKRRLCLACLGQPSIIWLLLGQILVGQFGVYKMADEFITAMIDKALGQHNTKADVLQIFQGKICYVMYSI